MKIAPYLLEFGDSQGEAAGLAGTTVLMAPADVPLSTSNGFGLPFGSNSEIALRTPT